MDLRINQEVSHLISFPPPESSTVGGGTIFWLNWGQSKVLAGIEGLLACYGSLAGKGAKIV